MKLFLLNIRHFENDRKKKCQMLLVASQYRLLAWTLYTQCMLFFNLPISCPYAWCYFSLVMDLMLGFIETAHYWFCYYLCVKCIMLEMIDANLVAESSYHFSVVDSNSLHFLFKYAPEAAEALHLDSEFSLNITNHSDRSVWMVC